jgi:Tripartite tricarboxylate transporter TctB family
MKLRGNSYFLMVIMAIMLVIVGSSLRMDYFKSKLLPILVGSIVFILAAVALKQEILPANRQAGAGIGLRAGGEVKQTGRAYLIAWAWVIGFLIAIYLIGFVIAIPLFILAYMNSHGIGWIKAVIFAILTVAFVYGIFDLAVGINLYPGLLFS